MKLFLKKLVLVLMATFVAGFWQMYFSERPELAIDPATLAGDGSLINYCEMPILNSQGKLAMDIPKGNTPGCAYDHFPLPVLSCLLYTSPSPRDRTRSRMPSSA